MPILDLQKRIREAGRIRMGDKTKTGAPNKLEKFRLTSSDRGALEAAAQVYGGTVRPWEGQKGQFELYLDQPEIDVFISPTEVSQWYEQWTAGGCTHRCDGQINTITDQACSCDPEKRKCKMTTRVGFFLPKLQSLGLWRLESHGYYAATELPQAVEMLQALVAKNIYVPAKLAIEPRTVVREGKTNRFIVPVIRIVQSLENVMALQSAPAMSLPANAETGEVLALGPGEDAQRKAVAEVTKEAARKMIESHGLTRSETDRLKELCKEVGLTLSELMHLAQKQGANGYDALVKLLSNGHEPVEVEVVNAEVVEDQNPFEGGGALGL